MPPVREKGQLRPVLPWPAWQQSLLDTGAQRQFRLAPCPQGVHGLVRDRTVYDLGAGPVSSPISNTPRLIKKATVEAPQLRRARGTPEKIKTELQKLINGGHSTKGDRRDPEQTLAQTGPGPGITRHN